MTEGDLRARLQSNLGDRYTLVRELGAGGMATVFLATDSKHGREVALKVLRPEVADAVGAERFLREIETAARLNHPHILPLHDSGEAGGLLYYVMPYVEGESLKERLEREGPLPVDEALRLAAECAEALEFAHQAGIVHRDLKPGNILFSGGHAVVADFGIARALEDASDGEALTQTGILLGSVGYMSPEQASEGQPVDPRSDVYALACVVYEILTGERAFPGRTLRAVMARQLTESTPSASTLRRDVPEALDRVIQKALRPIPGDRYASAAAFSEALQQAEGEPAAPPTGRSRLLGRPVVAALLTLVVGGLAWTAFTLGADGASPSLAEIRSLAVVPLENLAANPEAEQYFADGMTEALTAELGQISALTVKLPTSARRLLQTGSGTSEVARILDVDALLMGSVRRAATDVVVTVRLVQGVTGELLWTRSYNRSLSGVLALQTEVARDIATQIQVILTPGETRQLAATPRVDSVAYDHYLRGRYEWNRLNLDGWERAIEHFERSIAQDPSYAPAHAMMSAAYSFMGYYSPIAPARLHARALTSAERAVALDSASAAAHASLSLAKTTFDWDWTVADRESQEALRLNPSSPLAIIARSFYLSWTGQPDAAVAVQQGAVELDPAAGWTHSWLASHLFWARRYEAAIAAAEQALSLEPDIGDPYLWLFYSYAITGRYQEAETILESITALPNSHAWREAWLLGMSGRQDRAIELIEQLPDGEKNSPYHDYFIAAALGEAGQVDRAIALLESSYEGRSALMAVAKVDPRLDALRDDPRFQELLDQMDFPDV